jgi:hypothetical protein
VSQRDIFANGKDIKAIDLADQSSPIEWIEAAESASGGDKLKRFSQIAYTGGAMDIEGFSLPIVVDIEGLDVPRQNMPVLKDHNDAMVVGHTDSIDKTQQRVKTTGVISGQGPHVDEILANAGRGFPWQVSIRARPIKIERVPSGDTAKANGRVFTGPLLIARKSRLKESSFVSLGADDQTSANIAASAVKGDGSMEFQAWLKAKGFDIESISAAQKDFLEASFNAEVKAKADADKAEAERKAKEAETLNTAQNIDVRAKMREEASAELKRIAKVQELAAKHPTIAAEAVEKGWDEKDTELAVLRASRANVPAIHSHGGRSLEPKVIEAALCKTLNIKSRDTDYKPEVLEAADRDYRRIGLHQLFITAAAANGYNARAGEGVHAGNIRDVLAYACGPMIKADGFSTLSLPNILENVANKTLLQGYMEVDQTWREISVVRSRSPTSRPMKYYRLLDNDGIRAAWRHGGEIKHATAQRRDLQHRSAKTYARMFSLTSPDDHQRRPRAPSTIFVLAWVMGPRRSSTTSSGLSSSTTLRSSRPATRTTSAAHHQPGDRRRRARACGSKRSAR